jgi:hypothetical protein
MPDPGYRSPLIDFFLRGEVARDIRLLAAHGSLAPAPLEQLALLVLLSDDTDPEIAAAAVGTIESIPIDVLGGFLARAEVPAELRAFFAARGVRTAGVAVHDDEAPLVSVPVGGGEAPEGDAEPKLLSSLPVTERMKLALRGTREQRAVLIRDGNRLVAAAVLSSPKLTDSEVESFARMGNVSEDALRIIGTSRSWTKHYAIVSALTRNPKTPPAISMRFLPRLVMRDLKLLATDHNVSEAVRLAAR